MTIGSAIAQLPSLSRHVVRTDTMERGQANHGIFLHHVDDDFAMPSSALDGLERRIIVEKITTNPHEIRIVDGIVSGEIENKKEIFPHIYDVYRNGKYMHVLMQYLSTLQKPKKFRSYVARALAQAIHGMNGIDFKSIDVEWRPARDMDVMRAEIMDAATSLGGLSSYTGKFDAQLSAVVKEIRGTPEVLCHNDVAWGNVAFRGEGRKVTCSLFDFGLVGLNRVGSDLHHFARLPIKGPKTAAFYDVLLDQYALKSGFDRELIRLNSHFYAFYRTARRAASHARNGNQDTYERTCKALIGLFHLFEQRRNLQVCSLPQ